MRRALPIAALALMTLAACRQEPTFDERYAATHARIEAKSQEIDSDLHGRSGAAAQSPAPAAQPER
ncbi:hypothetical protein EYB45_02590 [Erythrobacteraceae bacterium CFH 75059]|uniref:hypothetical protein n=1 Tax=Qipengyuania thermophila TaxID=2509361 RepID=UPI0010E15E72|nr:hypothetical protein [Qipengyuania thermophila]TCD06614.1 hypothetical protein EYB45_02590 [Erythrobacteraceae bacterium CFH 75059]